jgi:hypothetical protein
MRIRCMALPHVVVLVLLTRQGVVFWVSLADQ